MNNVIKRVWVRNRMVNIDYLGGSAFYAEDGGHTFQISGAESDGSAVALSGTVAGVFLRPDNTDVAITGSCTGCVASVTLPANCYDVPGRFGLTIFLTEGGQKTAIYAAVGNVARTSSGAVAPQTTDDVVDLINRISTAVATIPQSWTGLMADIAPTYSASAVYPAGAYVYYNGDLYRCTTAITTAETWTPAHWTTANLGTDLRDLKSAIDELDFDTKAVEIVPTAHVGYRYGYLDGELISSSGLTAWEFDAEPNRDYILQGLQVGTNNTYAVLFIDSSNNVLSIINDATQETGHLVPIKTPSECVKVKYSSSTNATWDASPKKVVYKTIAEQSSVANSVNDINVIEKLIGSNYELDDGYLDVYGNLIPPSGNKEVTTSFIPVMAGQIMNVTIEYNQIRNAWCAFCVYDANKTFVKRIADAQESTASKTWTYTVGGNIAYVRLSYRTFNDIKNVSVFFDKSIFERLIPIEQNQNLFRKKYTHLMNRQGEGYGFPDNSIEGITSALNDGFSRIRVSIACTSDNIIYCTHSSEMKNNATSNCLKLDGTTYTENVSINDVTSDFINRLLYKNYIIPTLESVMSLVCAYDVELTLEMKEAFTATQAQTLIDMINYYRIPVVISGLNAEDQLQAIIGISTDMRLGVIFHYTDSLARYSINQFSDKCKSLRFDCFLSDTISRESVTGIIHPNYGLKLGGSNPSASEIKDFLKWVDVCETARPYSEFV